MSKVTHRISEKHINALRHLIEKRFDKPNSKLRCVVDVEDEDGVSVGEYITDLWRTLHKMISEQKDERIDATKMPNGLDDGKIINQNADKK